MFVDSSSPVVVFKTFFALFFRRIIVRYFEMAYFAERWAHHNTFLIFFLSFFSRKYPLDQENKEIDFIKTVAW